MVAGQSKLTMDDLGMIQKVAKSKTCYNAWRLAPWRISQQQKMKIIVSWTYGRWRHWRAEMRFLIFYEKTIGQNENSKLIVRNNLRLPDNNNTRPFSDPISVWRPLFSCARFRWAVRPHAMSAMAMHAVSFSHSMIQHRHRHCHHRHRCTNETFRHQWIRCMNDRCANSFCRIWIVLARLSSLRHSICVHPVCHFPPATCDAIDRNPHATTSLPCRLWTICIAAAHSNSDLRSFAHFSPSDCLRSHQVRLVRIFSVRCRCSIAPISNCSAFYRSNRPFYFSMSSLWRDCFWICDRWAAPFPFRTLNWRRRWPDDLVPHGVMNGDQMPTEVHLPAYVHRRFHFPSFGTMASPQWMDSHCYCQPCPRCCRQRLAFSIDLSLIFGDECDSVYSTHENGHFRCADRDETTWLPHYSHSVYSIFTVLCFTRSRLSSSDCFCTFFKFNSNMGDSKSQ